MDLDALGPANLRYADLHVGIAVGGGEGLVVPVLRDADRMSVAEIEDAIGGRVEVRPRMYVALTYDHRLIDGREAVGFLRRVKDLVEDPVRLLLDV